MCAIALTYDTGEFPSLFRRVEKIIVQEVLGWQALFSTIFHTELLTDPAEGAIARARLLNMLQDSYNSEKLSG